MTNNELDIDKVIDMRKRKHLHTFNVKSITAMTLYTERDKNSEFKSYDKIVDVSSGELKDNTYAFMIVSDKKRFMVIMEPNEQILKSMKVYMTVRIG